MEELKNKIIINKEYNIDISSIPENGKCKVYNTGNITEVQYMTYNPKGVPIKKISKTEYVSLSDGEVHEFDTSAETRKDNNSELYKTFKKIRHLINNNFVGGKNEVHIILTYKENMTDVKKLYEDCKLFFRKLKYEFSDLDYISIVEPQSRGAWHCHILAKISKHEEFYIKNDELREMWDNRGFVKIKRLDKCDNIGAYLSAYLGDIFIDEIDSSSEVQIKSSDTIIKYIDDGTGKKEKKKIVKGGRLHLYPKGMNIYRKSKGILMPEVETLYFSEVMKKNKVGKPCFSEKLTIKDDLGNHLNSIYYIQINNKR